MKVFSVASANGGEGKTTVALNTAAALARKGLRVALVDADLRDPSAHEILGVNNDVGLSTYLDLEPTQEIVEGTPYDALDDEGRDDRVVEFLEETAIESLFILPSGPPCASPVAAIESPKMERMLADLRGIVDFVVIDTPAVMEAGEALTLAVLSDACLLVIGADRCEDSDALWIKHLLENVQTSIVGVFLNKASRGTMRKSVPGLEPSPEPRVPVGA